MFSTDGNTTFTILCVAASVLAASVAMILPSFTAKRRPAIVANLIGTLLGVIGATLVLHFWDLDISWLARIAIALCVLAAVMIALNSAALYQNRGHIMRHGAERKFTVI